MKRFYPALSLLALASTVAVGLIRASQTRWTDWRYLWMAVASLVGWFALRALWPKSRPGLPAVALGAITLLVAATAWVLGARHPVGIGLVSISYGLACAASFFFAARSETTGPAQP